MSDRKTEINKNLDYFLKELPKILLVHRGKFALLRHQKIDGYYDTINDALTAGNAAYPDGLFSIQQVTDTATDLGFYSHAMPMAQS